MGDHLRVPLLALRALAVAAALRSGLRLASLLQNASALRAHFHLLYPHAVNYRVWHAYNRLVTICL